MAGAQAHIAFIVLDVAIPGAASLKDKRQVVRSIKERLRARYNVSVAEIGHLDDWRQSIIGVTMIGNERRVLEQQYTALEQTVREVKGGELRGAEVEWL